MESKKVGLGGFFIVGVLCLCWSCFRALLSFLQGLRITGSGLGATWQIAGRSADQRSSGGEGFRTTRVGVGGGFVIRESLEAESKHEQVTDGWPGDRAQRVLLVGSELLSVGARVENGLQGHGLGVHLQ